MTDESFFEVGKENTTTGDDVGETIPEQSEEEKKTEEAMSKLAAERNKRL